MPDWSTRVRERLSGLRLDPATEAETIEELAQHVDDRYRDLLAGGVTEADADAQAWRELQGHPRLAREISHARTPLTPAPIQNMSRGGFRAIVDDAGFAWRRLRHAPGFAIVAMLTLTLTVGANTAILSIADAVLFRPLPYADSDGVSIIQMRNRKSGGLSTSTRYAFLHAIDDGCPSVSEAGLIEAGPRVSVNTAEGPEAVPTMKASAGYFRILGVTPAAGRIFSETDAGQEGRVAMLSYAAWHRRFGGDPGVIGGAVTLGASTFDIVGVLPKGFIFPSLFASNPQLVTLMAAKARGAEGGTFHAIVRAAPGVTRERAQAEVDAATAPVSASLPRMADSGPVLMDVRVVLYPIGGPIMRYLLAAAGLILILGCANLANMMLVRGRRGLRETAVRLALGASRTRLIRPMIFEALIIGIAGAGLAVATTVFLFDTLLKQVPPMAYGRAPVGVDGRVIVAALAMGLLGALAFSIVPAWRSAGVDVLALIQRRAGPGGRRRRLGRPMVAAQVAIAVAVVFGAAIAGRAFVSVLRTPLGFSAENVLRIGVAPPRGATDPQQFYERALAALAQRSDVVFAGAAGGLPFSGEAPYDSAQGAGAERPAAGIVLALPGFFETVAMPVLRGRTFTWDDARGDPTAAVVSASAAHALFGTRESLGATFRDSGGREYHVVGVVGDVRQSLDRASLPSAYVMPGSKAPGLSIVVRMREGREAAIGEIKTDLRALVPTGVNVDWWSDQIGADHAYRDPRFQTIVLGTLAALALGLTALGIFSVVAYLVSARTREMGVRLAIGATPRALVGLVIRQALVPVALGLVAGVILIKWLSRLVEAQFFKVETQDPLIVFAAMATVVIATLVAAYLPARRATRINPAEVLRAE